MENEPCPIPQNTTNLFHDDRSYLLVGLVVAASSGWCSLRASAVGFRG
jgi:hypothetical protein